MYFTMSQFRLVLFLNYHHYYYLALINRAGGLYGRLLYGSVSQGLGTTKFTNLIG